jgi:hypothetical protein
MDKEWNATLDASYMHDCQEGMVKLMMLWLNADFLSLCTDNWIDADKIGWSGLIPRMNEVDIKDLTCWLSNTCKICCQFNLLVVEHCENVMQNEWLRLQHWHLFDIFVTVCLCMRRTQQPLMGSVMFHNDPVTSMDCDSPSSD